MDGKQRSLSDAIEALGSALSDGVPNELNEDLSTVPSVSALVELFELTPLETVVVTSLAGREINAAFAIALSERSEELGTGGSPNFAFFEAWLGSDTPSWMTSMGRLRYWQLVDLHPMGKDLPLALTPLQLDPRILNFLLNLPTIDERLSKYVAPVEADIVVHTPSQKETAGSILKRLQQDAERGEVHPVVLAGEDFDVSRALAGSVASALGMQLFELRTTRLPVDPEHRGALARLWRREERLQRALLFAVQPHEDRDEAASYSDFSSAVIMANYPEAVNEERRAIRYVVKAPDFAERKALLSEFLAEFNLGEDIDSVAAQFCLSASQIKAASDAAIAEYRADQQTNLYRALWRACRSAAEPKLGSLVQRIETIATWSDLILPDEPMGLLRSLPSQVANRPVVYEQMKMGGNTKRGQNISALFAGPSGTGKTTAAEIIAQELDLDLLQVDISSVVSKYHGETEEHLRETFDEADRGAGVLLFDEADSLFGHRAEIKDSRDRASNREISYLLQRLDAYRGLVILTTNYPENLDQAIFRRISFRIDFPFPSMHQRLLLWRAMLPEEYLGGSVNLESLARLSVTGGYIRNMAKNSAFFALQDGSKKITPKHLLRAVRAEYAKMDKPLPAQEIQLLRGEAA